MIIVNSILGFLLINIEIPNFIKEFGDKINFKDKAISANYSEIQNYIASEKEILEFLKTKFEPFLNREFINVDSPNLNKPLFDLYYKAGNYNFIIELKMFRKKIEKSLFSEKLKKFEESFKELKLDKIFIIVMVLKDYEIPSLFYNKKIEFIFLNIL
ncbi:MAG: hypothetical protein NTV16_00865 [Actinobacteria bacterium]|nr:hypothetical protein [Actinomycetota bacterium]